MGRSKSVRKPAEPKRPQPGVVARGIAGNPLTGLQRQADKSPQASTLGALQRRANGVAQRDVVKSDAPDWAKEDFVNGVGRDTARSNPVDKSSITGGAAAYDAKGNLKQDSSTEVDPAVKAEYLREKAGLRPTPRTDRQGRSLDPAAGVKLWAVHEFLMEETTMIASMVDGKIGSVYFPGGRVRTTHAGGPAVQEHAQARTLQFNIDPTACWQAFVAASPWLADMDPDNDVHMEAVRRRFKRFKVFSLTGAAPGQLPNWASSINSPDDALPVGTDTANTTVKLFEIMLRENGTVGSTHPSRGAAVQVRITRADLMKLKAVAKTLEGIPDPQAQNDAFYRYVTMKMPHLAGLIRSPDEVDY